MLQNNSTEEYSIKKQFPFIEFCLWSTKWLNEFMLHQPVRFYTIVEVEKEVMEAVFYSLSEDNKNVFLDPSEEIVTKYVGNAKGPIIITGLTTEAPIQNIEKVHTPKLEKILVDIFCDPILFAAQQGAEMRNIYRTAFEKYTINQAKMLRYATRRNKREEIEKFIINILKKQQ